MKGQRRLTSYDTCLRFPRILQGRSIHLRGIHRKQEQRKISENRSEVYPDVVICREVKRSLSGVELTYNCELVALSGRFGILKYELDREWRVGSLNLQPGMFSYGLYWVDRPYTLYLWFDNGREPLAHYFNLADSVTLSPQQFVWRDLVVDILVWPTGEIEVLDESELPTSVDDQLMDYIESSKALVLENYEAIIQEAKEMLAEYVGKP